MKKFLALCLALAMVFALCACGSSSSSGTNLTFTTGGDQGTYYGFGSVIGEQVSSNTGTKISSVTSTGSKANIEEMDAGNAALGFVQSDVMAYAYNGERLFEKAVDSFSVVAALYMEQVQIVTLNPDIKTVADLKGKAVSIGAAGSGVYYNAMDIMNLYGLEENVDFKATYQSFDESAESLKDGNIDAFFCVAGAPTPAVVDLAASKTMYLVSLDEEHIDQLLETYPSYIAFTIPADTYGLAEDCTTVAVGAVIIASNDVADVDVYNFLYGVFENLDALAEIHAKANELSLEFASSFVGVPYHAGAVQYFADKGIEVPAE